MALLRALVLRCAGSEGQHGRAARVMALALVFATLPGRGPILHLKLTPKKHNIPPSHHYLEDSRSRRSLLATLPALLHTIQSAIERRQCCCAALSISSAAALQDGCWYGGEACGSPSLA